MTVQEFILHVTEELDKVGSPYFDNADLLRRGKESTYNILEKMIPIMENDQNIREDFSFLVRIEISEGSSSNVYTYPTRFYRLLACSTRSETKTYPLKIVQANDFEKLKRDPFHSPTQEDPMAVVNNSGIEVLPMPKFLELKYVIHPVFGKNNEDEFINDLPDQIFYTIANDVITGAMATTSDQRYQVKKVQSLKQ